MRPTAVLKRLLKGVITNLDGLFKTGLYDKALQLEESWNASRFLNAIRRGANAYITKSRYKFKMERRKLHLGCGNNRLEGYVNIDWRKTRATDLVCDIKKLPYPDGSISSIETYHVIEHLPRHDLPKALREWHRVLAPGGRLVIECPDFDEAAREYLDGNDKRLDNIFGLQRFLGDAHMFGYNLKRLESVLSDAGFENVRSAEPTDYHKEEEPCMRVEAAKAGR
jgi:predicted SAM-dependent methyltransferase